MIHDVTRQLLIESDRVRNGVRPRGTRTGKVHRSSFTQQGKGLFRVGSVNR